MNRPQHHRASHETEIGVRFAGLNIQIIGQVQWMAKTL